MCIVFGLESHYIPKVHIRVLLEDLHEIDIPHWLMEEKGLEGYQT